MPHAVLGSLLRYLRQFHNLSTADATDGELLRRYASGDEAAFAELVRRHASLVWGVCRRLLNNELDTEDAFQGRLPGSAAESRVVARSSVTRCISAWSGLSHSQKSVELSQADRSMQAEILIRVPAGGLALEEELAKRVAEARCGLLIIDLRSGDVAHWMRVEGMVRELYDVVVLPQVGRPMVLGFKTDEIQRIVAIGESGSLE